MTTFVKPQPLQVFSAVESLHDGTTLFSGVRLYADHLTSLLSALCFICSRSQALTRAWFCISALEQVSFGPVLRLPNGLVISAFVSELDCLFHQRGPRDPCALGAASVVPLTTPFYGATARGLIDLWIFRTASSCPGLRLNRVAPHEAGSYSYVGFVTNGKGIANYTKTKGRFGQSRTGECKSFGRITDPSSADRS